MRLIKQSILPLVGALAAAAMSFFIGWIEGSKTTLERDAALQLVLDVTNYNLLEEGKLDRIKSNLSSGIYGDISGFDLFEVKDSVLSAKYKISTSIVEKGRAIAEEQKNKFSPKQTESK